MVENIISELRDIKFILSKLLGTSDLEPDNQFSAETLDKAAKLFLKLRTERGEWIEENNLSKYFKNFHWYSGKFIREHFMFKDYYKQGHTYFYKKKTIQRLAEELKKRNIDLSRYIELVNSQTEFEKKMEEYKTRKKGKRPYTLPDDLRDVQTSEPPRPDVQIVKDDLKRLKEEFFSFKMAEYVDIYRESYAMMKTIYYLDKYLDSSIKNMCRKWCDNFNYANHAYQLLTKKKAKFIPVKDDDMFEL